MFFLKEAMIFDAWELDTQLVYVCSSIDFPEEKANWRAEM